MKKLFKLIIVKIITWEARLVLRKYKPKVIAITGSVGKTSTKDAVFIILSKFKTVRKSEKSFNSEIGLPLTILGCPNGWDNPVIWIENIITGLGLILFRQTYPEYLVLEVGLGKPGDIKKNVSPWLSPDFVIITRFPDKPAHIEFFNNVDDIIEEKSSLAYALKKKGTLILNHDDEKVYAIHGKADRRTVSYGSNENATYRYTNNVYLSSVKNNNETTNGISFKLEYDGNVFPIMLPNLIGMHYIDSVLAAIACANEIGCDLLTSINYISEYVTPPGRLNKISGINDSVIIDDTYNSSPIAAIAALEALKNMKSKRKIAVLGDMLELGKYTKDEHINLGKNASNIADILIIVGPRSKDIALGAIENGFNNKNIHHFENAFLASNFLVNIIKKGDLILVKGSQGVRLERVVEAIMEQKELRKKLLCRQEKEWRDR